MSRIKLTKNTILHIIAFAVICILFFALRFINIEKRIIFDWDQERDAFEIKRMLIEHKPVLIGPRVVGVHGFFLAPYYTYLLLPFYILSNLHPIGSMYFVIFVNLVFVAASFFIIKTIWGKKFAALFLLLWGINPLLVSYDITPWNVLLVSPTIMFTLFVIYKLYTNRSWIYWCLLGITLALGINFHFQFVFMILLAIVFIVSAKKQIESSGKNISILIGSFLLMFLPLLIFDLRHDFLNTNLFINFFLSGSDQNPRDMISWILVLNNAFHPIISVKNTPLTVLFYVIFVAGTFWSILKTKGFLHYLYISFLGVLLSTPIFFILYGKRPSEYYFVFLYPLLYIVIINLFTKNRALLVLIIALVLFGIHFRELQSTLKDNNFGLYYKDLAVKELIPYTKGKKFNISFDLPLGAHTGYDYLIEQNGIEQSGVFTDPLVQINIPPHKNDHVVHLIGFSIPKEFSEVSSEKN